MHLFVKLGVGDQSGVCRDAGHVTMVVFVDSGSCVRRGMGVGLWTSVMRFRCDTPNSGPSDFLHHILSRSCFRPTTTFPPHHRYKHRPSRLPSPDLSSSSSYTLTTHSIHPPHHSPRRQTLTSRAYIHPPPLPDAAHPLHAIRTQPATPFLVQLMFCIPRTRINTL